MTDKCNHLNHIFSVSTTPPAERVRLSDQFGIILDNGGKLEVKSRGPFEWHDFIYNLISVSLGIPDILFTVDIINFDCDYESKYFFKAGSMYVVSRPEWTMPEYDSGKMLKFEVKGMSQEQYDTNLKMSILQMEYPGS